MEVVATGRLSATGSFLYFHIRVCDGIVVIVVNFETPFFSRLVVCVILIYRTHSHKAALAKRFDLFSFVIFFF